MKVTDITKMTNAEVATEAAQIIYKEMEPLNTHDEDDEPLWGIGATMGNRLMRLVDELEYRLMIREAAATDTSYKVPQPEAGATEPPQQPSLG